MISFVYVLAGLALITAAFSSSPISQVRSAVRRAVRTSPGYALRYL